jgi:hypothetical protein
MIVWGLARPRRRDWSTALVGAALLHRGCTGRATFDAWLDLLRTHGRRLGEPQSRSRPVATAPRADAPGDRVEAASQESFPASDPPSYSPGHA